MKTRLKAFLTNLEITTQEVISEIFILIIAMHYYDRLYLRSKSQ
jgi:hypothetical protein